MKFVSVVLLVVVVAITLADNVPPYDLKDAPQLFEKFIKDYNRNYKDEKDREIHFEAFKNNLVKINKDNAEQPTANFAIGPFADNTPEEFKKHLGLNVPPKN